MRIAWRMLSLTVNWSISEDLIISPVTQVVSDMLVRRLKKRERIEKGIWTIVYITSNLLFQIGCNCCLLSASNIVSSATLPLFFLDMILQDDRFNYGWDFRTRKKLNDSNFFFNLLKWLCHCFFGMIIMVGLKFYE